MYTAPGMQARFRLVHDCMPTRAFIGNTNCKPLVQTENKQDLLAGVVRAQISLYWAYGRLEITEIMWVRTNNYEFHTFRSVILPLQPISQTLLPILRGSGSETKTLLLLVNTQ